MPYVGLIGVVFLSLSVREVNQISTPIRDSYKSVTPRLSAPVKDQDNTFLRPVRRNRSASLIAIIFGSEFRVDPR